jgi:hypothetical protein
VRAVLIILSVALIVVSGVCATLRLLPTRWTMRNLPLRQRTWPAVAASFLALGAWFFHGSTPYKIPLIVDAPAPTFRILHVEKRGLHFHETAISAYRMERSSSNARKGICSITNLRSKDLKDTCRTNRWRPSEHQRNSGSYGQRLFTTENKTAPPQLVVDMFSEIDELLMDRVWTERLRDVCFGFCYGPLAALGFRFANSFPL